MGENENSLDKNFILKKSVLILDALLWIKYLVLFILSF